MLLAPLPEDGLAGADRLDGAIGAAPPPALQHGQDLRDGGRVADDPPPGASRKTAAWKGAPAKIEPLRGATVTPSSSSSAGAKATSAPNESRSTPRARAARGPRRRGATSGAP